MSLHKGMTAMAAAAVALALAPHAFALPQVVPVIVPAPTQRPNVIIVMADDLGWGDLAVYGHPDVQTPHLDALAQSGRLLTQFYVSAPVCSPSRASLLTGRFAAEIGIHYTVGGGAGDRYNSEPWLSPDAPTLYDLFQAAGYATGHFGKWHLGARSAAHGAAPPPEHYGVRTSATTNSTGPRLSFGGGASGHDREDGVERSQSSAAIVEEALGFIDDHEGQPFLMNLWTLEPHAVLSPTDEQMEPYLELTHPTARERGWRSSQTVYYASITNVDQAIGTLMEGLETRGLRDNTIVIFTSDNGPSPLWSLATGHAGAGLAGPFRGAKGSLYEGGVRVPFVISWPQRIQAGVIDDTTVMSAVDVLPTLTELAGLESELPQVDGETAVEALSSPTGRPRQRPLFWDYRFGSWGRDIDRSPQLAMRDGDWKLMMNPDGSRTELYNLARDRTETSNVAAYEPDRVTQMQTALLAWYETEVQDPGRTPPHAGQANWRWPGSQARGGALRGTGRGRR